MNLFSNGRTLVSKCAEFRYVGLIGSFLKQNLGLSKVISTAGSYELAYDSLRSDVQVKISYTQNQP